MAAFLTYAQDNAIQTIDKLQWQHRIILVKEDVICEEQHLYSLNEAKSAVDERHILWFLVCNDEVHSNYPGTIGDQFVSNISEKYFIRDDVSVMLIGKDGGIKRRTDELNLEELFALIDSMPMRQSEMNR